MKYLLTLIILLLVSTEMMSQEIGNTRQLITTDSTLTAYENIKLINFIKRTVDIGYNEDISKNMVISTCTEIDSVSNIYIFDGGDICLYTVYLITSKSAKDYMISSIDKNPNSTKPFSATNEWIVQTKQSCYYYSLYKYDKNTWIIIKY